MRGREGPHKIKINKENVKKKYIVEVPWVETDANPKSRKVMLDMLNYLSELNSPLHHFLCNNSRVNEITSTNP